MTATKLNTNFLLKCCKPAFSPYFVHSMFIFFRVCGCFKNQIYHNLTPPFPRSKNIQNTKVSNLNTNSITHIHHNYSTNTTKFWRSAKLQTVCNIKLVLPLPEISCTPCINFSEIGRRETKNATQLRISKSTNLVKPRIMKNISSTLMNNARTRNRRRRRRDRKTPWLSEVFHHRCRSSHRLPPHVSLHQTEAPKNSSSDVNFHRECMIGELFIYIDTKIYINITYRYMIVCTYRSISHCRVAVEGSLFERRLPEICGQGMGDEWERIEFRAGEWMVDGLPDMIPFVRLSLSRAFWGFYRMEIVFKRRFTRFLFRLWRNVLGFAAYRLSLHI